MGADSSLDSHVQQPPSAVTADNALINRLQDSQPPQAQRQAQAQDKTPPAQPDHRSYLESGVDFVVSKFTSSDKVRNAVDHYGAEFLTTASLFTGGKVGLAASFLTSGLNQASPDESLANQAEDFALGGVKGVALKGLFQYAGKNLTFAPTKGIAVGVGSRALNDVLNRDTLSNPASITNKLEADALNPTSVGFDALSWTLGEGLFGAANVATRGALAKNPLIGGMTMGATFGVINGGGNEILREHKAGEAIDPTKILEQSAIEGVINGAASGVGMGVGKAIESKSSDANARDGVSNTNLTKIDFKFQRDFKNRSIPLSALAKGSRAVGLVRVENTDVPTPPVVSDPEPRQFVITDGQEKLAAFRQGKSESAMINVRELLDGKAGTTQLGPQKSLFVQQLNGADDHILPEGQKADLIASSHPENLPSSEQEHHVFGDGQGKVWLATDSSNRLLIGLNATRNDVQQWRDNGFTSATRLDGGSTTFNVMAPLAVGDLHNPNSPESAEAWRNFDAQLAEAKKVGADSVSTDVWWGLIEPKEGEFNWEYYDKISDHVAKAGLKWVPILSFHQCGGNVGDDVNVPIPSDVFTNLAQKIDSKNPEDLKYKSEQGHTSNEYVSLWADDLIMPRYENVMREFQNHFGDKHGSISEINVSLGPAGELRYPSYNGHDQNAGYPTRGALQSYGPLAIDSFRDYALTKYGSLENLAKAWHIDGLTADHILPPDDPQGMYNRGDHFNTQYGKDFFDWYNQSLIDHGARVMTKAAAIFGDKNSPMYGIDLGAKVPGVNWRVGHWDNGNVVLDNRLAELDAGLIRTSAHDWDSDDLGRGYRPILSMFRSIQPTHNDSQTRIIPGFTCLEMFDGNGGPSVQDMPHTLANWFGMEAARQGLWLKGENALNGNLYNPAAWDSMRSFLQLPGQDGDYHGLTFLRMSDVVGSDVARAKLSEMVHAVHSIPSQPTWWQLFFRNGDAQTGSTQPAA